MAINFSVGDYVIPNPSYIENSLKFQTSTPTLQQTLSTLGTLVKVPSRVAATGNLTLPAVSFIRLVPTDTTNSSYNGGAGVNIYFTSDTLLNNSLELSTGFIPDEIILRCLNNSGSTITKNQVVRQTGFDASSNQVPIIVLASASAESTSTILGVASEDIANGAVGAILTSGSYQVDTSSFTLNAKVYLSNTNGAISTSPGTVNVIIGRVLSVSANGSIAIASTISGGGGSTDSFFTPGTGTNAGIGKGATAPTAAGANSLAQGNACVADTSQSFAFGSAARAQIRGASSTNNLAFGTTVDAVGYQNICFGNAIDVYGGAEAPRNNFLHGDDVRTLTYGGQQIFASGINIDVKAGKNNGECGNVLAQGKDIVAHTYYANGSGQWLIQGRNINTGVSSGAQGRCNLLLQGQDITFAGTNNSFRQVFAQGKTLTIPTNTVNSFTQGVTLTAGTASFSQGYGYSTWIGATGYASFAQGAAVKVTGDYSFGQGGWYISNAGNYSFAQGQNITLPANTNNFAQGGGGTAATGITLISGSSKNLVQGGKIIMTTGQIVNCLVQGYNHNFNSGGNPKEQVFCQGTTNTVGYVQNSFVQGDTNTLSGSGSFVQGSNCQATAVSTFAQGFFAVASRNYQRTFGSNRAVLGAAQFSRIPQWVTTTNATQTTLLTFTLEEDRAYSIRIQLVAFNDTTTAEAASFILTQAVALRNTGGSAVLPGTPISLTRVDNGGGSALILADLASSGNNLLLRVTGEAGETYQWCCNFEFAEVKGT